VSTSESPDSEAPSGGVAATTASGIGNWCADELEPIAGGGCFAAPQILQGGSQPPLLVYLHDSFARENARQEVARQSLVARAALARGFAVLALLGERGECKNGLLSTSFCWPAGGRTESDGPRFVTGFQTAFDEAERRVGTTAPRYLLGVGNGGYFAVLIATRSLARFDGVAVAEAGPIEPIRAIGTKPPILLVSSDDAEPDPEAVRLDRDLTDQSWPHAVIARPGGRSLLSSDVEVALTFFQRTHEEKWPLIPPMDRRWRSRTPPVAAAAGAPVATTPSIMEIDASVGPITAAPNERPIPPPAPNPPPVQTTPPAAPPVQTAPPAAPSAAPSASETAPPSNPPPQPTQQTVPPPPGPPTAPLPPGETVPPPAGTETAPYVPPTAVPSVPPALPPGVPSSPPAGVPQD
jgi:hypothetical protein